MLNKAMLIGRLGQDPELSYSGSGVAICRMSLATDESYTDREGNRVNKAEWHKVVVFSKMAENCSNYLRKGSLVYVEGSLGTSSWEDRDSGQTKYKTEIKAQRVQFLDPRRAEEGQASTRQEPPRQRPAQSNQQDEVPF